MSLTPKTNDSKQRIKLKKLAIRKKVDSSVSRSVITSVSRVFDKMKVGEIIKTNKYEIEYSKPMHRGVAHLLVTRFSDKKRMLVVVDEGFGFVGRSFSVYNYI